jgi:hypothetical protein
MSLRALVDGGNARDAGQVAAAFASVADIDHRVQLARTRVVHSELRGRLR